MEHIPTFQSCKDHMYNQRHKTLPTEVSYTAVGGEWVDNPSYSQSTHMLNLLAAAVAIYFDSTSYNCPALFYQLNTFRTDVAGTMFPLVCCLISGKNQHLYTQLLTLLIEICKRHDVLL